MQEVFHKESEFSPIWRNILYDLISNPSILLLMERSYALELDRLDPLNQYKKLFYIDDNSVCYLDGNSLGRLPMETIQAVGDFYIDDNSVCYLDGNSLGRLPIETIQAVEDLLKNEWGKKIVGGWTDWIDKAQSIGDLIGRSSLGAAPGQTLALDTNTINLYQLAWAAVKSNPSRKKILIDRANFPSDRYAMEGIANDLGMELVYIENEDLRESENEIISNELLSKYLDKDVALVTLQIIQYRSGGLNDYASIEKMVRDNGSLMLWDCSHAIGSVNLQFDKHKIGLAVGCTYKYGNSGPGAPGWLYVSTELIRGFQISTPPIIGLKAVEVGFKMIEAATMELINEKCLKGTDLMIALYDEWLKPLGFKLATPRDSTKRCGHIIITHQDGAQIAVALRQLKNVFPDYREPNGIRFSFSPLPTSFVEVYDGFKRLKELAESGEYKTVTAQGSKVT